MLAQVKNCKFYYAVQVHIPEAKNSELYTWQTVETYKEQYKAIELRQQLMDLPIMTINEIYKQLQL